MAVGINVQILSSADTTRYRYTCFFLTLRLH